MFFKWNNDTDCCEIWYNLDVKTHFIFFHLSCQQRNPQQQPQQQPKNLQLH